MTVLLAFTGMLVAQAQTGFALISGEAVHRERMAIPAGAVLTVSLDAFDKEGQSNVVEVSQALSGKQSPFPFQLPVQRSAMKSGVRYGLRAEVVLNGKRMFETAKAFMINPNSKIRPVLQLVKVQTVPGWSMADKEWELFAVDGRKLEGIAEPPTIRFDSKETKIFGFAGVNRYFGTYRSTAPSIQIDPGGMTMMAGEEAQMQLESRFVQLLEKVNRATVEEGELILARGEKELLRFRVKK